MNALLNISKMMMKSAKNLNVTKHALRVMAKNIIIVYPVIMKKNWNYLTKNVYANRHTLRKIIYVFLIFVIANASIALGLKLINALFAGVGKIGF